MLEKNMANIFSLGSFELKSTGDLEAASYYLLAKLAHVNTSDTNSTKLLEKTYEAIVKSVNMLGGFFSIHDTVIALEAIKNFNLFYTLDNCKLISAKFTLNEIDPQNLELNKEDPCRAKTLTFKNNVSIKNDEDDNENLIEVEYTGDEKFLLQVIQSYILNSIDDTVAAKDTDLTIELNQTQSKTLSISIA